MIIAGTIRNSVSLASLENKWQQKRQDISKGSKENLTAEEIEYLKKNDPEALKEYEEVKRERASYKKKLKNCKSKEEVEKLKMTKMGHYMAEAKEITNDPYIPKAKKYQLMKKMLKKTSAVEAEQEKFLQSLRYAELPDEEKEGTALSDVSLSGETVDALEEIKRMAEGPRTGIPENVTNRDTDTTAGSIDLKI